MNGVPTGTGPVLAGVDPGPATGDIVRFAAREAELRHAALHLLHAVDRTDLAPGPGAAAQAVDLAASALAPYAALVRSEFPRLDVVEVPTAGRPSAELLDRSADSSLVVLGHRGRGGFPRLALGSVALQVATHAACPVIVVRAVPPAAADLVAVGFDLPEDSGAALEFAFAEAALRHAPLEIVHADRRPQALIPGLAPAGQTDQSGVVRAERGVLESEAALLGGRHPGVSTTIRIEHTHPVPALLDTARNAALLVVGSHRRAALTRLLLGSVAGEALHRASCPVAVVPTAVSPPPAVER